MSEFYTDVFRQEQWHYHREIKQTEAARDRMLAHPDFIEWLPTVADRGDHTWVYGEWRRTATALRARIRAASGVGEPLAGR